MTKFTMGDSLITRREELSPEQTRFQLGLKRIRRDWFKYIFGVAIPLILYAIFIGYPILGTIYLSLFDWDGLSEVKTFIGLDNYRTLFADPSFIISLKNNVLWLVLSLTFPVIGGLIFAAIITSGRIYLEKFFLVIMLLPVTLSMVAVGTMFSLILHPVIGAANRALELIGLGFLQTDWFGPDIAIYTLIGVSSWSAVGLTTLMFHAAMSQVPDELYEFARLEGANFYQTFIHVTLPLIKSAIVVVSMLVAINSMRVFDLVEVMTRGGPFKTTQTLGYLVWLETFKKFRYGYGASVATVILLLSSVFIYIYIRRQASEALKSQ